MDLLYAVVFSLCSLIRYEAVYKSINTTHDTSPPIYGQVARYTRHYNNVCISGNIRTFFKQGQEGLFVGLSSTYTASEATWGQ